MRLPNPAAPALSKRGLSQVEVLCATAVLMVAALGFSRAMVASMHLADATRQQALASEAARRVLEEMQDATFANLIRLYNTSTSDNPVGVSAPGATFVVEGLTPAEDDSDGIVGAVEFPTSSGLLYENANRPDFGLPRDLDGNGSVDAADHSGNYALLPVRIVVRWRSNNGPMQVELKSFLAER